MPGPHRLVRARVGALTALAVGLTTLAVWQSTVAQQDPPPLPGPGETTLVLLVRTDPDVTKQKVGDRLTIGLDLAKCKYEGTPIVTERSAAFFEEMEDLFGRGGAAPPVANPGTDVQFRELPSRARLWECKLPKAGQRAKSIVVTYQDAKEKAYSSTAADPADRLTTIVPGTYALQLLPTDQALSWKAEVEEQDPKTGDVKAVPLAGKWPQADKYYAVTINKFLGDQKELFNVLETKIANPLKSIQPVRNYTFAFASWSSKRRKPGGPILVANTYQPMVDTVEGSTPARVWMLFPLTKAEVKAKTDEFRKPGEIDLPKEIRKANPVLATAPVGAVDKDTPAKWYELLDAGDGKGFNRPVPLADFKGLNDKFNKKGEEGIYRLLVWEFGDAPPQALEFQHPVENRNVFVLNEEVKQLAALITVQAAEPVPPPKK